ncbi:hypothetical protein [Histidinibacterium lentulum]|uniref:Sulfotransferase domain-containing protein n=1 Tax=Histidinibacterium lentulum TaxID=2480588 RepID=A0A3N2R592_9RHOB|nr:hypothetical protein [Histidinibacterium lentulum]ROU02665.1 hypothetical protein EAT49_10100 [Histidinibacterium lentulum]
MRRPDLFLHVGSHKTGTTAIQKHFAGCRDDLPRDGVLYPEPGAGASHNHNAILLRLSRDPRSPEAHGFARRVAAEASGMRAVLLSAEVAYRAAAGEVHWASPGFAKARRDLMEQVIALFPGFSPRFVLCLRRPDRLAEAYYAETMVTTPDAPDFTEHLATRPYRYDYVGQVQMFRSVAPLTLIGYEAATSCGLVATFRKLLGLPVADDSEIIVRPSVAIRAQAWLRDAKRASVVDPADLRRRWRFALERGSGAPFNGPPASFWPDGACRRSFVARSLAGFDELEFDVPGDPPPLLDWSAGDQEEAEHAYRDWTRQNAERLAARAAAGLRAFE